MERYDVAVIGGGPGGYIAAIRCAQLGKRTVLIERGELGGTCLNRGCIPTKALLTSAKVYETVQRAEEFGISTNMPRIDYAVAAARKDKVVASLRHGVERLVRGNRCTLERSTAALLSPRSLQLEGGTEIGFNNLILATGSRPAPVPFPVQSGAPIVDSDGFLSLVALPRSAVIVGGGVIGVEFATLLTGLGCDVEVVEALPDILAGFDSELVRFIRQKLEMHGVRFRLNERVSEIRAAGDGAEVCLTGGETASGEHAVVSVGRRAVTDNLNLETAGIRTERGYIVVDDCCETSEKGIYAVGDVNGRSMLAHAAYAQGEAAAESIASGKPIPVNFNNIPACVYCHPELASVGLTAGEARSRGIDAAEGRFEAVGNGRLLASGEGSGFVKLVFDRRNGELLGAHLCCAGATELIGGIAAALRLESTVEELAETVWPHPTASEMIAEAARDCRMASAHRVYSVG